MRAAHPNAVETRAQERFLAARGAWTQAPRARAIHAALLGGAMGDSLGAEIEFLPLETIRRRFPDGPADLPPHQGLRGAITDDTQMTLFTAEGLIRAAERGSDPAIEVHRALWRWHGTQRRGGTMPADLPEIEEAGLAADPRLNVARAPGTTCLSALSRSVPPGIAEYNDSKGYGTIMRVAPVAFAVPREQVRGLALATSALTHGHPTGQWAAAAWAEILTDVRAGAGPEEAARAVLASLATEPGAGEPRVALEAALATPARRAARDGGNSWRRLGGLGGAGDRAPCSALRARHRGRAAHRRHPFRRQRQHRGDRGQHAGASLPGADPGSPLGADGGMRRSDRHRSPRPRRAQRTLSVASPTSARISAMIQKRTTIWLSAQPFFSKWWWMGAIRKTRLPVILK